MATVSHYVIARERNIVSVDSGGNRRVPVLSS